MPDKPDTTDARAGSGFPGQDDPDVPVTLVVGIAGAIVLFALIVFLQALYGAADRAEFRRKVVEERPQELLGLRATQLGRLSEYRWVDPKAGVVAIPVERAMELMVQEDRAARREKEDAAPAR